MNVRAFCFVMVSACAVLSGCDEQPDVCYVADLDSSQLLQLTAVQGDCASPRRICYLTTSLGEGGRGCWSREGAHIRARFPGQEDKLVPVVEFRSVGDTTDVNVSLE